MSGQTVDNYKANVNHAVSPDLIVPTGDFAPVGFLDYTIKIILGETP